MKVTKIRLNAKCSDLCWMELQNARGDVLAEGSGYVPDFMPGKHYGDYIELEIDPRTGKILNWQVPSDEQMVEQVEDM